MPPVVVEHHAAIKKRQRSSPSVSDERQGGSRRHQSNDRNRSSSGRRRGPNKERDQSNDNQDQPTNKTDGIKMYNMNPFPRSVFLKRFSVPELMRVAHISTAYYNWVRGYMAETKVLNIKACSNKICLSREPCKYSNFSCTHRVIRSVSSIEALYKAGLLCVDTICIQVPSKPKNTRCAIHMIRKTTSFFRKGIRRVIIDVSNEEPYVEIIRNLLTANDDTLEKFMVRNSDVDRSRFNFPHFLNRTSWFVENFPMRKGYLERKKQRHAEKRQKQQGIAVGN